MSSRSFTFQKGNLRKLLAVPAYLLGIVASWLIPRNKHTWAFGSGIGVAGGALSVALALQTAHPEARIVWLVGTENERSAAATHRFETHSRSSFAGFWVTLRSRYVIVTHGLGDVNRFAVTGAFIINLWHGTPLKRLHLDSPVTTHLRAPSVLQKLLKAMYRYASDRTSLIVAGSRQAATRLRSAFQVLPGKVQVLGEPRLDALIESLTDKSIAQQRRSHLNDILGITGDERLVLYAPTWRDGAEDPAGPSVAELAQLSQTLREHGMRLVLRSHPLGVLAADRVEDDRVHRLSSHNLPDITPYLACFSALITDFSSIGVDFSLTEAPIVWFAPDEPEYERTRGLYEPLTVTAEGLVKTTWSETITEIGRLFSSDDAISVAYRARSRRLALRFHEFQDGASAKRVVAAIRDLAEPEQALAEGPKIFFESFHGTSASCNPLAIDRAVSRVAPNTARYWSIASESVAVPKGAIPVLVGSPLWFAARSKAQLIVVNDWLRLGFRRNRKQTVLQTWHGTPLKHLALGRPRVTLRTRLAVHRESRRWNILLSENDHSTAIMRGSYAFRGEVWQVGYPRTDRLERATANGQRLTAVQTIARSKLGIDSHARVLLYAPTWRDSLSSAIDDIDVSALSEQLGEKWLLLVRGHSRTTGFPPGSVAHEHVRDVTHLADINDLLLTADLLVTDYSSVMFDAAVAALPTIFYVPDIEEYRDRERGFSFDFEQSAPGPLIVTREDLLTHLTEFADAQGAPQWLHEHERQIERWREVFLSQNDGEASRRVVERLQQRQLI